MKKVLLTSALMLTFAFSYATTANEAGTKEGISTPVKSKPVATVTTKTQDPDWECFVLCCGTVCFPAEDCGDCTSPENIEDTFDDLENEFCC